MTDAIRQAQEIIEIEQERKKKTIDLRRRASLHYKIGDLVVIQIHTLSNTAKGIMAKRKPHGDGPYKVTC